MLVDAGYRSAETFTLAWVGLASKVGTADRCMTWFCRKKSVAVKCDELHAVYLVSTSLRCRVRSGVVVALFELLSKHHHHRTTLNND